DAGYLSGKRYRKQRGAGNRLVRSRLVGREQRRRGDRHRRGRENDSGGADSIEQRDEDDAAEGGAEQIGRVDGVDARREPRDRESDDESAGEERQRRQEVDGE